jgi:uncharacterized protein (AIM24 family)
MSTLKVSTLQNLSGTEVYTCKAWVNFNGTGTVAIRASGNVSSITDNGTGNYTINFTTALSDANYATVCSSSYSSAFVNRGMGAIVTATGSVQVVTQSGTGDAFDNNLNNVAIFR